MRVCVRERDTRMCAYVLQIGREKTERERMTESASVRKNQKKKRGEDVYLPVSGGGRRQKKTLAAAPSRHKVQQRKRVNERQRGTDRYRD